MFLKQKAFLSRNTMDSATQPAKLLNRLLRSFLLHCVYIFYHLISWTWKLEVKVDVQIQKGFEKKERFLFAVWHEDIFPILMKCAFVKPCIALVSSSQDGDILAHFLKKKDIICVRGSSRNKAIEGTKELLRKAKGHHANIVFAVDGSKGPRHEVKTGVFGLSHLLDYPVCFVVAQASRKYIFQKSWINPISPFLSAVFPFILALPFPPITPKDLSRRSGSSQPTQKKDAKR